jgi:hypothetical protein
MLKVHTGKPTPFPVPIGNGFIVVHAASSFMIRLAQQRVTRKLAALIDAEDGAALAASALGEEFRQADFSDSAWIQAAAQTLSLLDLATQCIVSWSGPVDQNDVPLELNPANIAIVLRDHGIAEKVESAINIGVHQELAEKNELAALPRGEAEMDGSTAPAAEAPASAAQ